MVIAPHSFHVMMVETGETRHRNGLPENPSPNYDGLTEEREEDMREDLLEMRGWPAPLSGNPSTGCGVRPPSVFMSNYSVCEARAPRAPHWSVLSDNRRHVHQVHHRARATVRQPPPNPLATITIAGVVLECKRFTSLLTSAALLELTILPFAHVLDRQAMHHGCHQPLPLLRNGTSW